MDYVSPTSPYAFTRPPVHAKKPKLIQKVFICKMGIYRYYYIIISKFQLLRKEIEKVSFTIKWLIIAHISLTKIIEMIRAFIYSKRVLLYCITQAIEFSESMLTNDIYQNIPKYRNKTDSIKLPKWQLEIPFCVLIA